jgi:hypothetical protein
MKKLFGTLALATTLALTSTAALADSRHADVVAFKKAPEHDRLVTLDAQRVMMRAGTITLDAGKGARKADLSLQATDGRIMIQRVVIQYAGGRSVTLRGNRDGSLDLPDGGRIVSVKVQYQNRGARGGMIKLLAKDARPGRPGFQQR